MRRSIPNLILFLATLLVGVAVWAAVTPDPQGLVTKSASGTTSAIAYFQGGPRPTPVTAFDVTSDGPSSTFTMALGDGGRFTALTAAAGTATSVKLTGTGLASNDVMLVVSGSTVLPVTLTGSTSTTNKSVTLHNPIGTNVASGSFCREVTSTYFTSARSVPITESVVWVNAAANLAENDALVIESSPSTWVTNVVSTYATNAWKKFRLRNPLPMDLATAVAVREIATNAPLSFMADYAADATSFWVSGTNGLAPEAKVLIKTATDRYYIGTLSADPLARTNLTLGSALGQTVSAGDLIYILTTQAYAVSYPANQGEMDIILDTSTGLALNDDIVIAGSLHTFPNRIGATAASVSVPKITLASTNDVVIPSGARLYTITTNIYTTTFAAAATDASVILDQSTGLAAGDTLLISPSTGGHTLKQIVGADSYIYQAVTKSTNATAIAVGDVLHKVSSSYATPVGQATLRLSPTAWAIPQTVPARFTLTATGACSINAITVNYGQ